MRNLYEIGVEGSEIERILIQAEGELTPELEARLDSLLSRGGDVLDSAAAVVRRLTAHEDECKLEAKRFAERASMFERDKDNLKARILFAVDSGFGGRVKTSKNTLWGQNASPAITIELAPDADLEAIAAEYPSLVKRSIALNTTEVRNRLQNDEALPASIVTTDLPPKRFLRLK